MNGEKVESPCGTPRKLKFEQLRADYELFLQTFERPSWLYRYLQRRHEIQPSFMHRTLSYLKERRTRHANLQQKKRANFLSAYLAQREEGKDIECGLNDQAIESCLDLTFAGFFHGPGFAEQIFLTDDTEKQAALKDDFVMVDIHLIKVYHKRKKDAEPPMDVVSLGTCKAPWNPRSQLLQPCPSFKLVIPAASFSENGRAIKTHIVSVTISIMIPKKSKKKVGKRKDDDAKEPPSKRLKSDSEMFKEDSDSECLDKRLASFSAELIVFDRYKNCLLSEGDYELLLQENLMAESEFESVFSWEDKFKSNLGPFESFCFGPTIKFRLRWESRPRTPFLPAAQSLTCKPRSFHSAGLSTPSKGGDGTDKADMCDEGDTRSVVFYQFIYSNNTRQQTEAREGFSCPWCSLNCIKLYGLLRHLKACHNRFSFIYTPLKKGHRIDVCLNENFDGVLKHSEKLDIGFIPLEGKPIRRRPATEVLVARAFGVQFILRRCKHKEDLTEFTEPDDEDIDGVCPLRGHDRQYYHSTSSQVLTGIDIEQDSENDRAPDWLKEKTMHMIEDFTDVNPGEKALMKLWNIHVLSKGYIADFSIPAACKTFVDEYGSVIQQRGLATNFLLHLNNLFEFQVIPQSVVVSTMQRLRAMGAEE